MSELSVYILPLFLLSVFVMALFNKTNAFDDFVTGAKDGMKTTISLIPNIMGMIVAVKVFLASGIIEMLAQWAEPLLMKLHIDAQILPLMVLKPLSGSAALSVTTDILMTEGPDSFIGQLASIMQGSTDTTVYIITVYFAAVGLSEMKHALKLGLMADCIGFAMAIFAATIFFA